MGMTLEEFRHESAKRKVAKGEKPEAYTTEQKQFAVTFATEALGRGVRKAEVLRTLGISSGALDKWMYPEGAPKKFKRVQLKTAPANGNSLVLVTPGGNRIEGLDLEKAAALVKALG